MTHEKTENNLATNYETSLNSDFQNGAASLITHERMWNLQTTISD